MSIDSKYPFRIHKVAASQVLATPGSGLTSINRLVAVAESQVRYQIEPVPPGCPQLPAQLQLRSYQQQAIANWFKNQGRGTLKMATGSGKTITALAIAHQLYQQIGPHSGTSSLNGGESVRNLIFSRFWLVKASISGRANSPTNSLEFIPDNKNS